MPEKRDVYVVGARDGDRSALSLRIPKSLVSSSSELDRFVSGQRLLVASAQEQARAEELRAELEGIGAIIELQTSADAGTSGTWGMIGSGSLSLDSLTSLDDGAADEPELTPEPITGTPPALTAMPALDPVPPKKSAPPPIPPRIPGAGAATTPRPAPPSPVETSVPPASAFVPRPAPEGLELDLSDQSTTYPTAVGASAATRTPAPMPDATQNEDEADDRAVHEEEEEFKPVPGRLLNGELRKKPQVRLAVGVGLALVLGYILASPIARRAENKANDMRREAAVERARYHSEAQAKAQEIERQADEVQSSGTLKVVVVWLVLGGALTGVWYRVT